MPELAASRILAMQRHIGSGAWVKTLDFGCKIVFDTFAHYGEVCKKTISLPPEGCTVPYGGMFLVLYNPGWDVGRLNYTLAHEAGHIVLSHAGLDDREESEANRFASALLLPPAVIRYLRQRVSFCPRDAASFFGCSLSAASAALSGANLVTRYDAKILQLFDEKIRTFLLARQRKLNFLDIQVDS